LSAEIDVAIIGGGVIGCAVARELAIDYDDIFLFEKNVGITQGENQSSRNSGVIHSGIYYDQATRPEKAALCVEGNALLYEFCQNHQVPALKTGKLVVATAQDQEEVLELYSRRAKENGLSGVEKISSRSVTDMEPNVKAESALVIPSAGIVEPTTLVYRLHSLAHRQGVNFMARTQVVNVDGDENGIQLELRYPDGNREEIKARAVVNAAGVNADLVAGMLNPASPYELDPVRGDSYKFYADKRPELDLRGKNVYPTPESVQTRHGRHFTVGIHLTPTFQDLSYPPYIGTTVTVGPKLVSVQDRDSWQDHHTEPHIFYEKARLYFPGLRLEDLIWHQSGLQARLKDYPDFEIVSDPLQPNFINLLGIDSPGLTASLAIGKRVKTMVDELGL
jgi:L-2-hydroxyglutarate oxidase LhgO